MVVALDNPGHQCSAAPVNDLRIGCCERFGGNLCDQVVHNQNVGILNPFFVYPVEDVNVVEDSQTVL